MRAAVIRFTTGMARWSLRKSNGEAQLTDFASIPGSGPGGWAAGALSLTAAKVLQMSRSQVSNSIVPLTGLQRTSQKQPRASILVLPGPWYAFGRSRGGERSVYSRRKGVSLIFKSDFPGKSVPDPIHFQGQRRRTSQRSYQRLRKHPTLLHARLDKHFDFQFGCDPLCLFELCSGRARAKRWKLASSHRRKEGTFAAVQFKGAFIRTAWL